jgi:hypothetical protein
MVLEEVLQEYLSLGCASKPRSLMEASRQRATKRKMKILSHKCVSRKVMPLYFDF